MNTFETTTPITTIVDSPAGRVQFIAADRADTVVEVRPENPGKGRDVKAAEQTTVEYRDGILRIGTPVKNQFLGASGQVEITVQLPAGSKVDTTAAVADFRGVGRLGEVRVRGYGPIKIDESTTADLTTMEGDVTIGQLRGNAQIRTSRGNITVTAAPGVSAALDAGTSVGRIHNALKNNGTPDLTITATTSMGDINARSL